MYKWFLAWRYLNTKLIAFFGIASVMLCVAMVLVVLSVMGGFLDTVRARSRGLHSEIVVHCDSMQGFPYYEEFSERLRRELPEVVRITTPTIYTYGIFRVPTTNYTKPARVFGIRLSEYQQVNEFKKGLHYDKYFPGTTRLDPQQMPTLGVDPSGELDLPPDLKAANEKWRSTETDRQELARFDAAPWAPVLLPDTQYPGNAERVFAASVSGPGYEGPPRDGIIVGCDMINYRRADGNFDRSLARGSDVALTLMPLSPAGNPTGEPPVRWPLRYADDSRTGIYEIDSLAVYVDFDALQAKLAMDAQALTDGGMSKPRVNQVLIGLQPGVDLDLSRERINRTWMEFYAGLL